MQSFVSGSFHVRSAMVFRVMHVVLYQYFYSLLWLSDFPSYGQTILHLSLQSPVDGHLDSLHFLAIIDNAAVNIYIQVL